MSTKLRKAFRKKNKRIRFLRKQVNVIFWALLLLLTSSGPAGVRQGAVKQHLTTCANARLEQANRTD
jgi:hypothetical protein